MRWWRRSPRCDISEGDEIRRDVEAFLNELIEKKVVVAL